MSYVNSIIVACFAVFFNIGAHFLLKRAAINIKLESINLKSLFLFFYNSMITLSFLLGVSCAFIAALLYLLSLNKLPLTVAFPLTGLSFVIIHLLGVFMFNEKTSSLHIMGLIFILSGICLIVSSSYK